MFKKTLGLGALLTLVFAMGCSSISKEECEVGDWAGIGKRDANKGQTGQRYYTYVKECGEHGVQPDHNAYKQGYNEGLKSYCTAENGWKEGKRGAGYANICPKELARAFEKSYQEGRKIYELNSKINNLSRQIAEIDSKVTQQQNEMVAGNLTSSQVAMKAVQMDRLRQDQRDLERERTRLQAQLKLLDSNYVALD